MGLFAGVDVNHRFGSGEAFAEGHSDLPPFELYVPGVKGNRLYPFAGGDDFPSAAFSTALLQQATKAVTRKIAATSISPI